jgi:heat shock protein HslJ/chitodextrinase
VRYDWDLGDGTQAGGVSVGHAYGAAGTYTVQLTTVDAAGQTGTASISVVINAVAQTPPNAVIEGPPSANAGDPVNFTAANSTAGSSAIQSYTFNFGNGQVTGPAPESVASTVFGQAGTYNVTVTVTDQNGLSDSASMQIVVDASAGLQGTTWLYVAPAVGTSQVAVNLNFGAASLTGFSGCNTYNAPYTADGAGNITIGAMTLTGTVCSEDIMAQETAYIQSLQTATTYAIVGQQLTISTASGPLNYQAVVPTPYN